MDLRQLRFALAVARYGAIRRAAEALNTDQSIVSQKIRELEGELGAKLYERHSGGVRVTALGEIFLSETTRALQILDEAAAHAKTARRGQAGALAIGYVWSIAVGPAQELLTLQREQAPAVEVVLREQAVSELAASLLDRSLDLALLIGDAFPRSFAHRPLWSEKLFFAQAQARPNGRPRSWEMLKDSPLLATVWEDWTPYQRMAFRAGGPKFDVHLHDCSREGVLGLVAAGRGIAIAPQSTTLIPFPGVRFIPIADPEAECTVCAAWLDRNDNPALRQFIKLLAERYPDSGGR